MKLRDGERRDYQLRNGQKRDCLVRNCQERNGRTSDPRFATARFSVARFAAALLVVARLAVAQLAVALFAVAQFAVPAEAQSVQYGVTKSADSVTVGEPFEIRVRVRAPADASIRFPENPDTAGTVQARDPRTIEITDSVQARDESARYHVAAWDVGRQVVRLDDVVVTWNGEDRHIPVGAVEVFVRSVLPADSALRVPKPARPLWETRPFPWWLLAALLAAIALGLALWWWIRRRRRPPAPVIVDPYVRAIRELNRVEAMGLVDAGELTRFVALVVEVLRDYLAARHPDASLALTSRELVAAMRRHPTVPLEQLSRVLHEADLAKFAGWALSEERARNLSREARRVIEHEHRASQPAPAQQAAA
jgi:hypothetical protein